MESGNLGRVYRIVEAPSSRPAPSITSQHPGADKSVESDGFYTGYKVPGPPPPWPDTRDIPEYNFDFKKIHVSFHVVLPLAIKQS